VRPDPPTFWSIAVYVNPKLGITTSGRAQSVRPRALPAGFVEPCLPTRAAAMAAETRRRLPNRRGHELLSFEHGGIYYTAGFGRFENGDLAEIFLNTCKHGTAVDVNARDTAVAASLLLQHGCCVHTLRKALTRNSDGSASGPLARALDIDWRLAPMPGTKASSRSLIP
jgi:hypothetical protein